MDRCSLLVMSHLSFKMSYYSVGGSFIMSYKHRLQYTPFGHRKRELRSLAQKYLEQEASRCKEFALYSKKELRRYISRFLKKIYRQLSGLRGALLLSLLIFYHCTGSSKTMPDLTKSDTGTKPDTSMPDTSKPDTSMPDTSMPDTDIMSMPEPKRIFVANLGQTNKVYRSDGAGVFTGSNISADMNDSRSIAVGDLNGDNVLDVVVANFNKVNRVYLGDGSGGFTAGTNISSDTDQSTSIALDDLDGDGDLDIVVANYTQTNKVYLGDGSGNFTGVAGSNISSDTDKTYSIALGNLNGGGHLDIVVGNYDQTNKVYLDDGTGTGNFTGVSGSNISSDADDSTSIAVDDLNGDDHLDIVVGNSGETNKVYLGDGSGDFTGVAGSNISSDTNNSRSIALGDLGGKNGLDVVVANFGNASFGEINKVYLGDGSGDFTGVAGSNISSDENKSYSIALGDVDGDGNLDIVVGNLGETNKVYLGDGSGVFTGSNISTDENNSRSIVIK